MSPLRGFLARASCIHGLAPVATTCRPFGTTMFLRGCAEVVTHAFPSGRRQRLTAPATEWRQVVAMGVSPWNVNSIRAASPEGTIGNITQPIHVAPPGLFGLCFLYPRADARGYNMPSLRDYDKLVAIRVPFGTTPTRMQHAVPQDCFHGQSLSDSRRVAV